jgi:endonuclease/exonuclease/phosphatase (EEP) superfamily protein YafD
VHPDIETHLKALLTPVPGVRAWVTDTVWKWPYWTLTYLVRVEATGPSKSAANDAAHDADAILTHATHAPWEDGYVLGVDVADAPAWSPRENGAPVYAAAYRITARPKGTL